MTNRVRRKMNVLSIEAKMTARKAPHELFDLPDPAHMTVDERISGRKLTLSIVVPAYNEENTILRLLSRLFAVPLPCPAQVIVVDDGSRDRTVEILRPLEAEGRLQLIVQPRNLGKGAALRAGFAAATGDIILVQDADEEYDPRDIPLLVEPILDGRAKVVYGSRTINNHCFGKSQLLNPFYWGGRSLTWVANALFRTCRITDEAVGYKIIRRDLLATIPLRCTGFEFCPELTAKVSRRGVPIYNLPIRYVPRPRSAGKKIRPRHWFEAVWTLLKYRLVSDHGPVADFHPKP